MKQIWESIACFSTGWLWASSVKHLMGITLHHGELTVNAIFITYVSFWVITRGWGLWNK